MSEAYMDSVTAMNVQVNRGTGYNQNQGSDNLGDTGISLAISKAGTYTISYESNSSYGSYMNYSKLYKNGAALSGLNTGHAVEPATFTLTDVSLVTGDVLSVYASISVQDGYSKSFASNLLAIQTK